MQRNQKGFTLVELAIVMVIIGLLIGGILKGQQILENARVSATVTQVGTIDAAAKTFYDTYSGYPGDLMNAQDRVPNCASCGVTPDPTPPTSTPCSSGDGSGNGVIGLCNWGMNALQTGTGVPDKETSLFWVELVHAGLLTGTTDAFINGGYSAADADFGTTMPETKVAGGFVVGQASAAGIAANAVLTGLDVGPVLMLISQPVGTPSTGPIAPSVAAHLDQKLDDGLANSGSVRSYGTGTYCAPYVENDTKHKVCGLYIRILKP